MRGLGFNTLVKDMEGYRSKRHTVDWLLEMTARDGDIDPKTSSRMARLCFLAEGSPTLRYIIHQLRGWVLDGQADSKPPRKRSEGPDSNVQRWGSRREFGYMFM